MKVLLVEDDASLREGLVDVLTELAPVRAASTVEEARQALREESFHLVLTDLRIAGEGEGGRHILEAARARLQPVTILSAAAPEEVALALRPHEPDAVLAKPFQLEDLLASVERFLALGREVERHALARQLPPEADWRPAAPGVTVAQVAQEACDGPSCAWGRMGPGAHVSWQAVQRAPAGVFLVEGDVEVDGEARRAPHYLFLASGPHEARTREGCLLVSLGLRG